MLDDPSGAVRTLLDRDPIHNVHLAEACALDQVSRVVHVADGEQSGLALVVGTSAVYYAATSADCALKVLAAVPGRRLVAIGPYREEILPRFPGGQMSSDAERVYGLSGRPITHSVPARFEVQNDTVVCLDNDDVTLGRIELLPLPGGMCELTSWWVEEFARGHGLGTELVARAAKVVAARSLIPVIRTQRSNLAAVKAAANAGFTLVYEFSWYLVEW
jgi:ribosomal protein S18 acetylase RimI-like enzyme